MRRTRLKYYLRVLGIGIVVTALLMGYSQKEPAQLSDEEIRQRAAELGMVEQQGVLSELAGAASEPQETQEPQQTAEPEETEESQETQESPQTAEPEETEESQETQEPPQTAEPEATEEPQETQESLQTAEPEASRETQESLQTAESQETDTVTLVIARGDTSLSVSRALAEAGLVEDSRTYDRFLCSGGYDKSIHAGTYEIPKDATEEEIARIITKKR